MFSQENSRCTQTFYRGNQTSIYKIHEINNVDFDTISMSKNDLFAVVDAFNHKRILSDIKSIVDNPLFIEMVEKYSLTSDNDQYTLESYASEFKNDDYYNNYLISKKRIDSLALKLLENNSKIINISMYTNLGNLGDCYFYQRGYDNFNHRRVSNSLITSVLYLKNYNKDNRKYIGIETTETGQIVILPLVSDGKYVCDIRLMLCI
jgi:hypothetical protein